MVYIFSLCHHLIVKRAHAGDRSARVDQDQIHNVSIGLSCSAWSHMLDTWGIGAQHVRFSTLCTQCHNETFGHVE